MEDELLLTIVKDILVAMDDEEEPCPPIDECPNKEQMENDDCKKCWAKYILAFFPDKTKPPLLSDNPFAAWITEYDVYEAGKKAQREADIKHYGTSRSAL